jgi:hypothetical protein
MTRVPHWGSSRLHGAAALLLSFSVLSVSGCESGTTSVDGGGTDKDCGADRAARDAPLGLVLPFEEGSVWTVGGNGSFYGEYLHTDDNDDFYATDWNCCNFDDGGEPLYPIAPGRVTYAKDSGGGYGNLVQVVHPGEPPFLSGYAHLGDILVDSGDIVFTTTQIGTLGSTGGDWSDHLHMSFKGWDENAGQEGDFESKEDNSASRKPSPMWTAVGNTPTSTTLCSGDNHRATKNVSVFFDVLPDEDWFSPHITSLYAHGFVVGCSNDPFLFCPFDQLTRAELAVLIVRGYHRHALQEPEFDEPEQPEQRLFTDVDPEEWYAKWAHQLYEDGFTAGCSLDELAFCPFDLVTKAEMAVFMLRARNGVEWEPDPPQGFLSDMDIDDWRTKWAEAAVEYGIMVPCVSITNRFCPDEEPPRALAAVWMARGFDLPLPPE